MPVRDRRETERSRFDLFAGLLYGSLRAIARHATDFRTAFGIFLIGGGAIAIAGTLLFVFVANHVRTGATQGFDDTVLHWMAAHRVPWVEQSLLEITALGTGLVVLTIVAVAALFLALSEHRYAAFLLLLATGGGIVLNNLLKVAFERPRPQVFAWGTQVATSSFPSGHAMSAAIVYGTVAYLAARLESRRWMRVLTLLVAAVLIGLICLSRLYLGVHYPSDVIAGVTIGLAWAGFCMAGLEAVRIFGLRYPSPDRGDTDGATSRALLPVIHGPQGQPQPGLASPDFAAVRQGHGATVRLGDLPAEREPDA